MNNGILAQGLSSVATTYSLLGNTTPLQLPYALQTQWHPEAISWSRRVTNNGGRFSDRTIAAVNQFCIDIDAAGIRDKFLRLNLMCGDNINAALVPLYLGQSRTGTQYGSTDANSGFVSADYTERGSSGGLLGNGSTKYLACNGLTDTIWYAFYPSMHFSAYMTSAPTIQNGIFMRINYDGGYDFMAVDSNYGSTYTCPGKVYASPYAYMTDNRTLTGHRIMTRTATNAKRLYLAGSSISSNSTTVSNDTAFGGTPILYGTNTQNGLVANSNARVASYSFGLGMTAAQALAYYTAIQTFQRSLSRQIGT